MHSLQAKILDNTPLYFRIILFTTFVGHGLASLGLSHAGYELHHRIFESVNFFHWNAETFLVIQGWWDILLGVAILSGRAPRVFVSMALVYLGTVAVVSAIYYHSRTGSYYGIGEVARRFAWIFYCIFLLAYYSKGEQRFSLLRIGIAFAFLAHGFASIGYFGMRGGQIEAASQIITNEETAKTFIYYSGFSDVFLGTLMLTGIFSRVAATIGTGWLVCVVICSFLLGIPEGIFRSAFLFSCLYVALDARCHTPLWQQGVVERGEPQLSAVRV